MGGNVLASVKLLGACFAFAVVSGNTARCEYWNNMGGPPAKESQLASEAMFRSASALFLAMARFEALDESAGNEQLAAAIDAGHEVIYNLETGMKQDYASAFLAISPDSQPAVSYLDAMREYGVDSTPTSVAELLSASVMVVSAYVVSLKQFQESRDLDTYKALRAHLNAALAVGEAGSAFLQDFKR